MLLLRIAVGVAASLHGVNSIRLHSLPAGVAAVGIGVLLEIGLLTPIAAILATLGAAVIAYGRFPGLSAVSVEASWMDIAAALVAAAIVLLGPGSISIDARLFGRRTIIIPGRAKS